MVAVLGTIDFMDDKNELVFQTTKEEKEHQKVSAAQPPVMAAPSKSGKKKSTAKVKMEPPEDYYNPTYDEMMLGGDIYDQQ